MRNFIQYLEFVEGSVFKRVYNALRTFFENRQGLLQDIDVDSGNLLKHIAEPFRVLRFDGASKDVLEGAIQKIENLAKKLDSGWEMHEALSDLAHMADNLENFRLLDSRFALLDKIDNARIKSNQF